MTKLELGPHSLFGLDQKPGTLDARLWGTNCGLSDGVGLAQEEVPFYQVPRRHYAAGPGSTL